MMAHDMLAGWGAHDELHHFFQYAYPLWVPAMKQRIVVGGHEADPCLSQLVGEAAALGYEVIDARSSSSSRRRFHWSMDDGITVLDGRRLEVDAAFLRPEGEPDASLSEALESWVLAHPGVAFLNRFRSPIASNRAAVRSVARACGLRIPRTVVSNVSEAPDERPRSGDAGRETLETVASDTGSHSGTMRQPTLAAPELRVYLVGELAIAFTRETTLRSVARGPLLVAPTQLPARLRDSLLSLLSALGMSFGAASLKTCPDTGELLFVDVDPSPVFDRCDRLSGGAISRAILSALFEPPSSRRSTDRPPPLAEGAVEIPIAKPDSASAIRHV